MTKSLPGTSQHQQILQTIVKRYANDDRILAVLLFGSLSRGNWDTYSDLDLDIVTKDDVSIDVTVELDHLCAVIKHENGLDALIISATDEADVVLSNLIEFSIRYHALIDTKPAILDSMILLTGTLSIDQVQAAGNANRIVHQSDLTGIVNQCIRYTLELHNAVSRQHLWMSLELLYRIRFLLMQLFTITHDGIRPVQFFEANASRDLHKRLKRILPHPEMTSMKAALSEVLHLLEHDLDTFSRSQYQLTEQQRIILQCLNQHR